MNERRSGLDRRAEPRDTAERRKRPGQPRLAEGEDSTTIHFRVPTSLYDATYRIAASDRRYAGKLSAVARHALECFIRSYALNSVPQK